VEREQIAQLADGEAIDAFYRCWTRKEAFIKAIGTGLSTALADFAVSVEAEEAALRWHAREPSAPARWQLRDIDVPEGYAAALAAEGHVARVVRVS